ncbi:hypothetical protein SAMN05192553_106182 [Cyclobacterium xiamenense]|uniref:Uncharacterized protein n=1 Tax=Cyclobacterium xiamenense TaxID=1297121 RepID=A0A1H7APW2_9BACT|nr:hypothetical protein SAMN05192553_106182 [Cyclobacterium xiamenense]
MIKNLINVKVDIEENNEQLTAPTQKLRISG